MLDGQTVVDSTRALLVWEPRRVVPSYAVPVADVMAELAPASAESPPQPPAGGAPGGPPVLHPGIPFAVHSSDGEALSICAGGETRVGAAFRPADPDLAEHVVLDFNGFDAWHEEDEPIVGHPRDPFHRVDIRKSSRSVRIELDGRLLAESAEPTLLFETNLPTRFYLPREDVRIDIHASAKRTYCPYKGHASYWSPGLDGGAGDDLIWSYEDPLPDAVAVTGLVAFFDERVDVILDGRRRPRPRTPFPAAILDEAAD